MSSQWLYIALNIVTTNYCIHTIKSMSKKLLDICRLDKISSKESFQERKKSERHEKFCSQLQRDFVFFYMHRDIIT